MRAGKYRHESEREERLIERERQRKGVRLRVSMFFNIQNVTYWPFFPIYHCVALRFQYKFYKIIPVDFIPLRTHLCMTSERKKETLYIISICECLLTTLWAALFLSFILAHFAFFGFFSLVLGKLSNAISFQYHFGTKQWKKNEPN